MWCIQTFSATPKHTYLWEDNLGDGVCSVNSLIVSLSNKADFIFIMRE